MLPLPSTIPSMLARRHSSPVNLLSYSMAKVLDVLLNMSPIHATCAGRGSVGVGRVRAPPPLELEAALLVLPFFAASSSVRHSSQKLRDDVAAPHLVSAISAPSSRTRGGWHGRPRMCKERAQRRAEERGTKSRGPRYAATRGRRTASRHIEARRAGLARASWNISGTASSWAQAARALALCDPQHSESAQGDSWTRARKAKCWDPSYTGEPTSKPASRVARFGSARSSGNKMTSKSCGSSHTSPEAV